MSNDTSNTEPESNRPSKQEAIDEVVQVAREWEERNQLLTGEEFADLRDEIAENERPGRVKKPRFGLIGDASEFGEIAAEYDVGIVEIGEGLEHAALRGISFGDGGYVPVFICVDWGYLGEDWLDLEEIGSYASVELSGELAVADGSGEADGDADERASEEEIAREVAGLEPGSGNSQQDSDPFAPDITPDAAEFSLEDAMGGDSPFASDGNVVDEQQEQSNTGETYLPQQTSAIPLEQITHLSHDDRKRYARKNGAKWPSTSELRDDLQDAIQQAVMHGDKTVIDAPTSAGKSYTVDSTRWGARDDITDGKQVVHALPTRDARDEAIEVAEANGVDYATVRSRDETCPLCAGVHDPEPDDGGEGDGSAQTITVDGEPVSEWIERQAEYKNIPISDIHNWLERWNDQGVELPCQLDGECESIKQWERIRDEEPSLIIVTHPFLHVPGLRMGKHVIIDEEPSFEMGLDTERVRNAVSAFLEEANCMLDTWEDFWSVVTAEKPKARLAKVVSGENDVYWAARKNGLTPHEYKESKWEQLEDQLATYPSREWYYQDDEAHVAAPNIARSMLTIEERAGDRLVAESYYEPLRPDGQLHDDDGYNLEKLTIVFNSKNEVSSCWSVPSFGQAESVVGLDAHPSMPIWQLQTTPDIRKKPVMSREERENWKLYERGLNVVQLGEATRPLASSTYHNQEHARTVIENLRDRLGGDFRTVISTLSVEGDLERALRNAGATNPETMHYGEEKSRNDFANEDYGLVYGCVDPGDDYVMDIVAALDLDAEPERSSKPCPQCTPDDHPEDEAGVGCHECGHTGWVREKGRNFEGEDAGEADAILASVRENHVAQAVGRYARNPDDPDDTATVFVATDAMPAGFADAKAPGAVTTYTGKQQQMVEYLREQARPVTTSEVADATGVTTRYARKFLNNQSEKGRIEANPNRGPNGATLYADTGLTPSGTVDVADGLLRNNGVQGTNCTWSFRVCDPSDTLYQETADDGEGEAASGGGEPPDRGATRDSAE